MAIFIFQITAMAQDQNLFTFISTQDQLDEFLAVYAPDRFMLPPEKALRNFRPRDQRICRFCNSPAGAKKFKKAAHVIPEFLGNKHLQSDFECDDCNTKFSKYESNFAAWLGMARTVNGTAGKNGIPSFKSPKERITARLTDFFNIKATKISTPAPDGETLNFDVETGKTVITYVKEPYVPIMVYKCMLKMALSMIEPEEVEQYRPAFKFLLADEPQHWLDEFAKVMFHRLPSEHRFVKPLGFLFKKIDPLTKMPMHTFSLYYESYILSFPLPFNELDWNAGLYKDLQMEFLFPPAIVFHQPLPESRHFSRNLDLSGYDKVIGEQGTVSFEMKLEDLENMTSFDPKTGVSKPGKVDGSEIVAVIFAPAGTEIKTDQTYDQPF